MPRRQRNIVNRPRWADGFRNMMSIAQHLHLGVQLGRNTSYELVPDLADRRSPARRVITLELSLYELLNDPSASQYKVVRYMAHEFGHYFIAPEGRRRKADYGIPPGSSKEKWDLDDAKATFVEQRILRWAGLDSFVGDRSHIDEHIEWQAKCWWRREGRKKINAVLSTVYPYRVPKKTRPERSP